DIDAVVPARLFILAAKNADDAALVIDQRSPAVPVTYAHPRLYFVCLNPEVHHVVTYIHMEADRTGRAAVVAPENDILHQRSPGVRVAERVHGLALTDRCGGEFQGANALRQGVQAEQGEIAFQILGDDS